MVEVSAGRDKTVATGVRPEIVQKLEATGALMDVLMEENS
jgi:hypothetical protein